MENINDNNKCCVPGCPDYHKPHCPCCGKPLEGNIPIYPYYPNYPMPFYPQYPTYPIWTHNTYC